jgi:hypothetical protein
MSSDGNEWDWEDGMRRYREGDLEGAYKNLGHVVHLIQDATVPAHTHLDAHGPPQGDDYEDWVRAQFTDAFTTTLQPVPYGTPIPSFETPWDAWQATAWASYRRNLYPGDLSDQEAPGGVIAEMFPDLAWSWWSENWTIDAPPVGDLGADFFEEEPGFFYFKNCEHAAAVDKISFDADVAWDTFAANEGGMSMTEGFARDLIPIAILHTAAVMKLYLDEAYAQPPIPDPEPEVEVEEAGAGCAVSTKTTTRLTFTFTLTCTFTLLLMVFRRRRS